MEHVVINAHKEGAGINGLNCLYANELLKSQFITNGYINISNIGGPVVMDAWNNPLIMCYKTNINNEYKLSDDIKKKTNIILIWSVGPNGSNEYGRGDDVFVRLMKIN
jgi:hypothetical protein